MSSKRNVETIPIIGGHIALDLVNTIDDRGTDSPIEYLQDFSDLLAWAGRVGGSQIDDLKRIAAISKSKPGKAIEILDTTKNLRDLLHTIFMAQAAGHRLTTGAVDALDTYLSGALQSAHLECDKDPRIALRFSNDLFWHLPHYIAFQGIALLSSPGIRLLKMCNRGGCGWIFLDQSRKRNRKWCSMQDCGNVIKQRRHRLSVAK